MSVTPTYPGVYIQEAPQTGHTIVGVSTSNAAFIDVFERGPANVPTQINSFGDFTATFGNLNRKSKASYGIYQFFLNGGSTAFVVRIAGANAATSTGKVKEVDLTADGPGLWGDNLQAASQPSPKEEGRFDLVIRELSPKTAANPNQTVVSSEVYLGLSTDSDDPMYVVAVLEHQSGLVLAASQPKPTIPSGKPGKPIKNVDSIVNPAIIGDPTNKSFTSFKGGKDDYTINEASQLGVEGDPEKKILPTGFYTLPSITPSVVNIVCIPAMSEFTNSEWVAAYASVTEFCESKLRAFFIADVPKTEVYGSTDESTQVADLKKWFEALASKSNYAAVYYPRLKIPDPAARGNPPMVTQVSGTMAGIYARTDAAYGVWKAPAGQQTTLNGVLEATVKVGDAVNGELNPLGLNVIRPFPIPIIGTVCWGTRTMEGADVEGSEWKYIPIRRTALWIEQTLYMNTQWAVFEVNDEPLWASLRLSIGAWMDAQYKKGAFFGTSAKEAYFVKCDASTTTAADRQNGIVNVLVGFAPQEPAEFVMITISQMTAQ